MTTASTRGMTRSVVTAGLLLVAGGGAGLVIGRGMRQPCPPVARPQTAQPKPVATPSPSAAPTRSGILFEATRDDDSGLFVIDGASNGGSVAFAVDTGAEITIVRERDAGILGARTTTDGDQNVVVVGSVLPMTGAVIPRLRVADVELENVRVLVGPDTLPFSLLGQHEISRLGSVEFDGDTMRVRPSATQESLD